MQISTSTWPPAGLHRDYRQDMLIKISFIFKLIIEIVGIGGKQASLAAPLCSGLLTGSCSRSKHGRAPLLPTC